MAGPIKISILADVGQAVKSVTHFSDVVDEETKRVVTSLGDSKLTGGFGKAQEGFDILDTRAMGFRDTITGVQDTVTGFQGLLGDRKPGQTFADSMLQVGMGVGDLASGFANFIVPMAAVVTSLNASSLASAKAGVSFVAQKVATAASAAATAAMTGAQWLLNAAMEANPLGIVILAVMALVAAVIIAYKNSETFRDIVQAVWSAIQAAVSAVVSRFTTHNPKLWTAAQAVWSAIQAGAETVWHAVQAVVNLVVLAVTTYINTYKAVVLAVWSAISSAASTVWNAVSGFVDRAVGTITGYINSARSTVLGVWSSISSAASSAWGSVSGFVSSAVDKLLGFVRGIPGQVSSVFSGAGTMLWDAGSRIVSGLWDGLKAKWESVKAWFSNITSSIPNLKGPASRDAQLLRRNGQLVIEGFVGGLESRYGTVRDSLRGLTTDIGAGDGMVGASGANAAGGTNGVNVTSQVYLDGQPFYAMTRSAVSESERRSNWVDYAGRRYA